MSSDPMRAESPSFVGPVGPTGFLRLRHVALPVFYLSGIGALVAAIVVHGAHPWLTDLLIGGTMVVLSSVIMGLEILGVTRFARLLPGEDGRYLARQGDVLRGYSWTRRAKYLAQAIWCWNAGGIATVLLSHHGGGLLRARVAGLQGAAEAFSSVPSGLRVLVAFVALDFWSYMRHRLEHAGGERTALWRWVHRWHHTPTEMNMWTGMVVHPAEAVLVFGGPVLAFGALGYARWEIMLLFALFLVIAMPQHMNSGWTSGVLGAVIHGPEAHTHHHSSLFDERNANFADCLTVWDRLFGTYRKPPPQIFRGPFGVPAQDGPP